MERKPTFNPFPANTQTLQNLLEARPVLWVGAGTSIGAGLPSTGDLVRAMRDEAPVPDEIPADATFPETADAFIECCGGSQSELSGLLQRLIGTSQADPTPALRAIARLAKADRFSTIVTTNYDDLLERVLRDAHVDFLLQSLEDNAALSDDGQLRLLKLHGSYTDWRQVILSGKSYDKFAQRYKLLMSQLKVLMTQRRVLFVGCSMQDPRILGWIDGQKKSELDQLSLWAMGRREHVLEFAELGTLDSMVAAVARYRPPVVHFTGHGMPGHLLFEDLAAHGKRVSVDTLVARLKAESAFPRLIYLASCYGATPEEARQQRSAAPPKPDASARESASDRDASPDEDRDERMVDSALLTRPSTTSTAAALHRAGLPQIVAYFGPVGDEQSTRAEAAFYTALARGRTARQAIRSARAVSSEPLVIGGVPRAVYPLGWAQLALYHRGRDRATTLAVANDADLPPVVDDSLQRIRERLDGGHPLDGRRGVERLQHGFIGRRKSCTRLYGLWQQGSRRLVVRGLGGLGKTTLCTERLPFLARMTGENGTSLVLDGRAAGESDDPVRHLWQQLESAAAVVLGDADQDTHASWQQTLVGLQEQGITGQAVAQALVALCRLRGGLVVYLDDAESLQHALGEGQLAQWQSAELTDLWNTLCAAARHGGPLGVLASCRYGIQGMDPADQMELPPMAAADTVRLLRWFDTLGQLPPEERQWLAGEVDGHPRTVEFLDALAQRRVHELVGPGNRYTKGRWREDVLQPVLPATYQQLDADLLLPKLWSALSDLEREHLGRCSVLSEPAPWAAVRHIAPDQVGQVSQPANLGPSSPGRLGNLPHENDTATQLMEAGLLSPVVMPIPPQGEYWWNPHRLVTRFVEEQWTGDRESVNAELGVWYQQAFEESGTRLYAERSVNHFLAAGKANDAWPLARLILLQLRGAGRYREALTWPEHVLAAVPSGVPRGMALAFQLQLGYLTGSLPNDFDDRAKEAESLVAPEDRRFLLNEYADVLRQQGRLNHAKAALDRAIRTHDSLSLKDDLTLSASLHSLAGVLQAQGDLDGARKRLERALQIKAEVFGTEIHPDVAASLHSLAMVCHAQDESAEAIRLLKKVIGIETQLYRGRAHYTTAETEEALGQILVQAGEVQEGLEMLVHALSVYHQQLGPQHPHTQRLMRLLAPVMRNQDSDEATPPATE